MLLLFFFIREGNRFKIVRFDEIYEITCEPRLSAHNEPTLNELRLPVRHRDAKLPHTGGGEEADERGQEAEQERER